MAAGFSFDKSVLEKALKRIYSRDFHPMTDIEEHLFNEFWQTFNLAAEEGFSKSADPDDDFREALRHNNAVFAAFKTHRMQNDMAARLLDENGVLKPFEQWKNDVRSIAGHQCGAWLKTEYDTAVIRARQAADWKQFERERDVLPNLKWLPSTSLKPGKDHKPFWGTILPIDHPFWSEHRPGDRWNCKCDLTSTDEPPTRVPGDSGSNTPHPGLDNNPGKDAALFSDSHPYIAHAYKGAKEAVEKAVEKVESIRKKFEEYDKRQWEHSYFSKGNNGFVVTEKQRIQEATASKQEMEKFKKELNMCKVAADNSHTVEYLHGSNREPGQTYDIHLDNIPTDLKSTGSHNNIEKYASKAFHRQGAKAILYELSERTPKMYNALGNAKRKYPELRIFFYYKDERIIKEIT